MRAAPICGHGLCPAESIESLAIAMDGVDE